MAVGDIIEFTGQRIEVEVRQCDGTALRRDAFPELFAAIGTTYGSTSEDDFLLPVMVHPVMGFFYFIEVDAQ